MAGCWWTLAVTLLTVSSLTTVADVAPQDADPFCLARYSFLNDDPHQVVLMDTYYYKAQSLVTILGESQKWISLKFLSGTQNQKWGDHRQSGCAHNLLSCYFTAGNQNNWLITQYINISTTEVMNLNVNVTFATATLPCTGECLRNVPIRVYWTNTPNETERNTTSNYDTIATKLVRTNFNQPENDSEIVAIPPNILGMYLALIDEGTCAFITRLVVSYTVCPAQTVNLTSFPQTVAPSGNIMTHAYKLVSASCVKGASLTWPIVSLVCNVGGIWGTPQADVCQCDAGYQMTVVEGNATCEACPAGQYKFTSSNTDTCQTCPQFSSASVNGSQVCMCDIGYYRAPLDSSSTPCTRPPSAPRNIQVVFLTYNTISLNWSPPSITGGRSDLQYIVTKIFLIGTVSRVVSQTTRYTNITLQNLTPYTHYTISVEAVNGLSDLIPATNRTTQINVTTLLSISDTTDISPTSNVNTTIIAIVGALVTITLVVTTVTVLLVALISCWRKTRLRNNLNGNIRLDHISAKNVYEYQSSTQESLTDTTSTPQVQSKIFHSRVSSVHLNMLSKVTISRQQLKLIEIIGQGEFGIVYRGLLLPAKDQRNTMPDPVAIKTLKGQFSSDDISSIMEESLKMKSFDHINVLNLLGVCVDTGSAPYIVMPLMSHGSLLSYLKKERHNLTVAEGSDIELILSARKQLLSMCLQVAQGMAYLASQKFVHRDLAARNCMVAFNGVIKVADFGLTEDVYQRNYFRQDSTSVKLPIKWMSLESLHDRVFSEKSDVWSFGVTSWEVFSLGRIPYPTTSPAEVVKLLDSGSRLTQPTNAACSHKIHYMMMTCWKENPGERPTFQDLVITITTILKPLADYMDFSDVYTAIRR